MARRRRKRIPKLPRRPLPDLCLISVFKMLTPNEQLVASKMNRRCAVLVRAANRRVKTLVITTDSYGELRTLKHFLNPFSLASNPSMQQLMDIPGETFPDFPMKNRLSKCNILQLDQLRLLDTTTIKQIVTIFSAVTELKFITMSSIGSKHIDTLISLLQHPNWQCQLTNLMVAGTHRKDNQLPHVLITAINGLFALKLLAFSWNNDTEVPDLSILAQLKTVVFKSDRLSAFLRFLERNAADNPDLKVHLLSGDTNNLLTLTQPLHSRIARYGWNPLHYTIDQVPLLCSQFRSLTSLSISHIESTKVGQLFSHLSQLHHMIHLGIGIDFRGVKDELPPPEGLLAQLNSVRALELDLSITSHSQIEWLNLPQAMPNLQIIHIEYFRCGSCGVWFSGVDYKDGALTIDSSNLLDCFRSSLFHLHPDVHLKRFILGSDEERRISAEKLMLQSQ